MNQQVRLAGTIVLLLMLALMALPAPAHAGGEPQLQLSAKKLELKVGQKVKVDLWVKNAPQIYGADVHLVFDPDLVEVVDADKKTDGIQVKPGEFLDPDEGLFLQYWVDNEAGTVDYALALLNPAPPSEGDGVLMQITFRGKADGLANVAITEGLFGTQIGDTIQPDLDQITITIGRASAPADVPIANSGVTSEGNEAHRAPTSLALAGELAAIGVVGVGGGWFWLRFVRR